MKIVAKFIDYILCARYFDITQQQFIYFNVFANNFVFIKIRNTNNTINQTQTNQL